MGNEEHAPGGRPAAEPIATESARPAALSAQLIRLIDDAALTIAAAESLTGGLVCDAFVRTPGASKIFRGGIVAYSSDVKAGELGVDRGLLDTRGAVNGEVAGQMAAGVARKFNADLGVATTGVAGPGDQDGRLPGTVFIAVVRVGRTPWIRELALTGDRETIRRNSVIRVLELTLEMLSQDCQGPHT